MPLKTIPARGGLGWAWFTPAWAVMVRPAVSAVAAAMVRTAVIQRRMRRVIAVSFTRCGPRSADHRGFEAAATADGCRLQPPVRMAIREHLRAQRASRDERDQEPNPTLNSSFPERSPDVPTCGAVVSYQRLAGRPRHGGEAVAPSTSIPAAGPARG